MAEELHLAKQRVKSNFSGQKKYDLIIIGSGISGLSSGLMWLNNTSNMKTLIVDKNTYPGGYCTAYERQGYVFETNQLFPDVKDMMDYLKIDIPLKPYENNFMRRKIVHGEEVSEYKIPTGAENFKAYLCEQFPEDAKNIKALMDYSVKLFAQVRKLKTNMKLTDKLAIPFIAPLVVANLNKTYSQLLDKFKIINPRIREVLETFTSFSGVPSDKAAAIMTVGAMLSSMTRCYRPYGYFDEFPAVLAEKFQSLGGEIRLGDAVEKIVVEDGVVQGVKLVGDTEMIQADKVITTVDPNLGMRKLVGDEHLPPEYIARLENTTMSVSSINVALGLDDKIDLSALDLDYPYNVVSTGLGTGEKLFEGFLAGDNGFSEECFHMAVICPSLTTGAKNTITLRAVPFALNGWKDLREKDYKKYTVEKEKWADFFIAIAEKYFIPELSKHIVVKDVATPATYERYSGSPTGSLYDMASLVTQFGPKRLPMITPIKNLYQPKFSHGIYGTMMNGVQVVDMILERKFNGGNSLFAPK
jgi:all-trans-retinol 13,14-reductase